MQLKAKNMKPFCYQKNGFSLVELMVALLISGIITLVIGTLLVNNQKELTALEDSQLKIDYKLEVNQSLKSYSACSWQLRDATSSLPLDLSAVTPATPASMLIPAAKLYSGADATSSVIFETGQDISLLMKRFKGGALSLKNIRPGLNPSTYIGSLVLELIPNGSHRQLSPLSIPISFSVDSADPIGAKKISQCCTGNNCSANTTPTGATKVNIFCHDASGSGHTCVKNINASLNLAALGVSTSQIKLTSCLLDSTNSYDDGHNWGGHPVNTLTYNQSTSDLSLTVKYAGVSVDVNIDYSTGAVSGLNSPFTCP